MVLEGPKIIIAVAVLRIFHLSFSFAGRWIAAAWFFREKHVADESGESGPSVLIAKPL